MSIKNKKSKKGLFLVVAGIIITMAAIKAPAFLVEAKENPVTEESADISQLEEVQEALFDLGGGEVNGLFFSMFPLDSYNEEDFLKYLGLNTIMIERPLATGQEMLTFLELALAENHALTDIYIGLCADDSKAIDNVTCGGLIQMFMETSEWDDRLFEMIISNPEIRFHIILDYPSIYKVAAYSQIQKLELYRWYYDASILFGSGNAASNIKLYFPGIESWLVMNPLNYLDNGQPNKDAAGFVLGQIICNEYYLFNNTELFNKISFMDDMLMDAKARQNVGQDATFVFFGDSIIGNYNDSMSIPQVVGGLTGAETINCGYGGLAAAGSDGLTSMIDDFLNNRYEHIEENKPIKSGIPEFYEKLPEIDKSKLVFFISIGINDYMIGSNLKSDVSEDTDTYKGALEYTIKKLQNAYPESEVILMTPNFLARNDYGMELINGYTMEDVVTVVQELAKELNVKCIDVYYGLNINEKTHEEYLSDRCHPNELGRYEIGKLIYQYFLYWDGLGPAVEAAAKPRQKGYGILADKFENLENNPFFDSLVYTGYNIEKHREDGMMWHYLLAAQKRGRGWLSDITYNGGSNGDEVKDGVPDIEFFEKNGLVCASYVTYVYFNYLLNISGVDTSVLAKPEKSYNADDWYQAGKQWVEDGYSKYIEFDASLKGGFIDFSAEEEIPIGSLIAFCDARNKSDHCSHIVIYAGYENDYHWVYHVGNENGPEFCSVQRMHFGPDPQWPLAVITTPDFVIEELNQQ